MREPISTPVTGASVPLICAVASLVPNPGRSLYDCTNKSCSQSCQAITTQILNSKISSTFQALLKLMLKYINAASPSNFTHTMAAVAPPL
jgi:hypothetical protein